MRDDQCGYGPGQRGVEGHDAEARLGEIRNGGGAAGWAGEGEGVLVLALWKEGLGGEKGRVAEE